MKYKPINLQNAHTNNHDSHHMTMWQFNKWEKYESGSKNITMAVKSTDQATQRIIETEPNNFLNSVKNHYVVMYHKH